MSRKVVVTGGHGFLGRRLVPALQDRGYEVRVFSRNGDRDRRAADVETAWGDIRDAGAVDAAVAGSTHVVHLVSNFRSARSDRQAEEINVGGTENVLRAAERHGVERLVHCSTIGVHGDVVEVPATEETPFNPGDAYQRTKLEAEQLAWRVHRDSGLPVSVIRPVSMYGPGDRRMLKLFRMIKHRRFVILGSGRVLFHPSHVDDVVAGFLLALEREEAVGEAFIVGGEDYLPLIELTGRIARILDVPPPSLRLPLAPVRWLAAACEVACAPLGVEPPLHRRRVSFYENDRAFRIDKARRLLGYRPGIGLDEGLRSTVQWYEEAGWL